MFVYQFSKRGTRHIAADKANEDSVKVMNVGNISMTFMADGMGSAMLAEKAALITVDAASKVCPWILMPHPSFADTSAYQAVLSAFPAAYNALQHAAKGNPETLRQLQTTFMAVIYNADTQTLAWGHCGDGGIIGLDTEGKLFLITQRQKGEKAGQTSSIQDPYAWQFGTIKHNVKAFALMTDGLLDRFCPFDEIDQRSYGATSLKRLLMLPENADRKRLSSWLDCLFDPEFSSPFDLGVLIDSVTDDRSIVLASCA